MVRKSISLLPQFSHFSPSKTFHVYSEEGNDSWGQKFPLSFVSLVERENVVKGLYSGPEAQGHSDA